MAQLTWYHIGEFPGSTNCVLSKDHTPDFVLEPGQSYPNYKYPPVAMAKSIFDSVYQATGSYQICGMCVELAELSGCTDDAVPAG